MQVSAFIPPVQNLGVVCRLVCNMPIKQRAFSNIQREFTFFGPSLARHHVNDYVSLSDGPLTSSRSYSRLHAAVERQKCDKRPGFGGEKNCIGQVKSSFVYFVNITIRYALKKNYGFIWECFPSGGPPPHPPLLGTPYSKTNFIIYFAF